MQTYPFGRIRGLLFLGLIITMLIFGIVSKCSRNEDKIGTKPGHYKDYHR